MKKSNFLKLSNYRKIERKEAALITGGEFGEPNCAGICGPIRCDCERTCGNNYNWCFHQCVSNAGCPV